MLYAESSRRTLHTSLGLLDVVSKICHRDSKDSGGGNNCFPFPLMISRPATLVTRSSNRLNIGFRRAHTTQKPC